MSNYANLCSFPIDHKDQFVGEHIGFGLSFSACMSTCSRYCLHGWIPHVKIADAYVSFFFELSPLKKLQPFEKIGMKFCKCHILKVFELETW